jgi:hypothetical protein
MGWNSKKRQLTTAALMLMGLSAVQVALAAPPIRPPQLHPQLQPQQAVRPQLDLRAPSHMPGIAEAAEKNFPSRRQSPGPEETVQLPALGSGGAQARPTIQEFVHRVHREGLPVARLFEGKSALVHLGLNPKGKPGLWLVQKTR